MKKVNIILTGVLVISIIICTFIVISSGQKDAGLKIEDVKDKSVTLTLKDNTVKVLKYKQSKSTKDSNVPSSDIYTDEKDNRFTFDKKSRRLTGVLYNSFPIPNKKISYGEAKDIAKKEIKKYTDLNLDEYQLVDEDGNYTDASNYNLTYRKIIDGVVTAQGVSVTVRKDGGVQSVHIADDIKIDEKSIKEKLKTSISKEEAIKLVETQIVKDASKIKLYSGYDIKKSQLVFNHIDSKLLWVFEVVLKETDNSTIEAYGKALELHSIYKQYIIDANTKEFVTDQK